VAPAKGPPQPFSLAEAQASADTPVHWYEAPLDMVLSTEEAVFRLALMMGKGSGDSALYSAFLQRLPDSAPKKLTLQQMKGIVAKSRFDKDRAAALIPMQILATLLTAEDLVAWLCESPTILSAFIEFRKRVLLYLSQEERESLRKVIRPFLDQKYWDTEKNMAFYLAASLGMHAEVAALVESWTDAYAARGWHLRLRVLQYIIFGLARSDDVERHMRRLKLSLDDPQFILGWIAHTEHRAIDMVGPALEVNLRDETKLAQLLAALATLDAPEVAPIMFECATKYRTAWRKEPPMHVVAHAADWMNRHVRTAVIGLVPFVASSRTHADGILVYLRQLARDGHGKQIEDALTFYENPSARVSQEVLQAGSQLPPQFDAKTTPQWLREALKSSVKDKRNPKVPDWVTLEELPPVLIDKCRLNTEQLINLVAAMQTATASNTDPLIPPLREHADADNLEKFVLSILDAWLSVGAPNPERWVIWAVGQLGSNRAALRLPPLIRTWRAGGNQPHAVAGLECLKLIGTDTALMQLNVVASDQRLKALKEKAVVFMESIAAALGLSRERLEDRLISTCGLDGWEKTEFDLGSRKFTLAITQDMSPALQDETGKLREDWPKPNKGDDADLVKEGGDKWKSLRRELKVTLKTQSDRLEQALVSQRRWFSDEFEELLVKHPVACHLVRRLLWGGFDKSGKLIGLFRVSLDGQYTDDKHAPVSLDGFAEIGLVHPLQLKSDHLAAWSKLFQELEIAQPFAQMQRVVHQLTEAERSEKDFSRLKDYILPAQSIPAVLDKRGWVQGAVESGMFDEHSKFFETANVTAICQYQEGLPVYFQDEDYDRFIDHCVFVAGKVSPESERDLNEGGLALGEVDAIVMSEVMGDLFELSKKAKSHAYE
jgi:hypothetical protein